MTMNQGHGKRPVRTVSNVPDNDDDRWDDGVSRHHSWYRHRPTEKRQLVQPYPHGQSTKTSSPIQIHNSRSFRNDGLPSSSVTDGANSVWGTRRRMDEVERIGTSQQCRWTTSLQTESGEEGEEEQANGIMFTLLSNSTIEILTLEFHVVTQIPDVAVPVTVHYRKGDFSGVVNDPSSWSLLAETEAQPMPSMEDPAAMIIPTSQFAPLTLEADTVYSLYLHATSGVDILRLQMLPDSLIGEPFAMDRLGLLSVYTGTALESEFPNAFQQTAQFSGRIHFKATQPCERTRSISIVELQFAVNEDPDEDVMTALSRAVHIAIETIMAQNDDLGQFQEYHGLEIDSVESAFMGIVEGKCPAEFESCSNIFSRAAFLHLPTVTSGEIQLKVLQLDTLIAESVVAQSIPKVQYVGPPVRSMDFVLTLVGVPIDSPMMNTRQLRYLEKVTVDFLQHDAEVPIFTVKVQEAADSETEKSGERILMGSVPRRLRGAQNRWLQDDVGTLRVVTTISGASDHQTGFLQAVIQHITVGSEGYSKALASRYFLPGEINEGNSGILFANITNASIMIKPDGFGEGSNSTTSVVKEVSQSNRGWMAVCGVGIVVSTIWILYRIYKDFLYSPPLKDNTEQASGDPQNGIFETLFGRSLHNDGTSTSAPVLFRRSESNPSLKVESAQPHLPRHNSAPNLAIPRSGTSLSRLNPFSIGTATNSVSANGGDMKPSKSLLVRRGRQQCPVAKESVHDGVSRASGHSIRSARELKIAKLSSGMSVNSGGVRSLDGVGRKHRIFQEASSSSSDSSLSFEESDMVDSILDTCFDREVAITKHPLVSDNIDVYDESESSEESELGGDEPYGKKDDTSVPARAVRPATLEAETSVDLEDIKTTESGATCTDVAIDDKRNDQVKTNNVVLSAETTSHSKAQKYVKETKDVAAEGEKHETNQKEKGAGQKKKATDSNFKKVVYIKKTVPANSNKAKPRRNRTEDGAMGILPSNISRDLSSRGVPRTLSHDKLSTPSSEALVLRETSRGVRRTASNDLLERRNQEGGIHLEQRAGNPVTSCSNERFVPTIVHSTGRRSGLKRTGSDERRGVIVSHLNDVLGKEDCPF